MHDLQSNFCLLQVVTAEQIMSQVTELTTLTGFGFSLDGKVDVDDNGYRGDIIICMHIITRRYEYAKNASRRVYL